MINKYKKYRLICVEFLGPTNIKGSRIKIYEDARFESDRREYKIFARDYKSSAVEQAEQILIDNNIQICGIANIKNGMCFMCDSYGVDFKSVKELV